MRPNTISESVGSVVPEGVPVMVGRHWAPIGQEVRPSTRRASVRAGHAQDPTWRPDPPLPVDVSSTGPLPTQDRRDDPLTTQSIEFPKHAGENSAIRHNATIRHRIHRQQADCQEEENRRQGGQTGDDHHCQARCQCEGQGRQEKTTYKAIGRSQTIYECKINRSENDLTFQSQAQAIGADATNQASKSPTDQTRSGKSRLHRTSLSTRSSSMVSNGTYWWMDVSNGYCWSRRSIRGHGSRPWTNEGTAVR